MYWLTRTTHGTRANAPPGVRLHLVDDLAAVPRRVDDAVVEELVGHVGRLVDEAARVAAQVEDDARELPAGARAKLRRRLEELVVRVLLELLHPDVRDAVRRGACDDTLGT